MTQRVRRLPREFGSSKFSRATRRARAHDRAQGATTIVCRVCQQELPLAAFPRLDTGGWAISRGCRECRSI